MPNDLSVSPVSAVASRQAGELITPVQPAQQAAEAGGRSSTPFANPTLRIDAQLGIVVIEFRSSTGAVTSSIPSQEQLDAYQVSGRAPGASPAPPPTATAAPLPVTSSAPLPATSPAPRPATAADISPGGRLA